MTKQLRQAVTTPTHLLTSDGTATGSNLGYSTMAQAKTALNLPTDTVADLAAKVATADIVDDLVSEDTDKPLSAAQGKVLKDAVDGFFPSSSVTEAIEATNNANTVSAFGSLRQLQANVGDGSLPHLKRAIWNRYWSARQPSAISVMVWGDSIAQDFMYHRAQARLYQQHGWKGFWITASSHSGVWGGNTSESGTTNNNSDFEKTPYGLTKTVATSGSWGFRISDFLFQDNDYPVSKRIVDQFTICFAKELGAGTFKVQYREVGGDWVDTAETAVDASSAQLDYGEVTVQVPRGVGVSARIVENGVGPITFLGVLAQDSTASGMILSLFTRGGINVTQAVQTNPALMDGMMRLLKPDVIVWNAADDLSMLEQDLDNLVQLFDNAEPYHDWAFILHSAGFGATDFFDEIEAQKFVREYAAQNRHYLFDMRAQSRDFVYSNREIESYRNITSVTRTGSVATATLNDHGFINAEVVKIIGFDQSGYNQNAIRVVPTGANTFTYAVSSSLTTPATGQGQVARIIGWQHDNIHCSSMGRDMQSLAALKDMGLIDGLFSKDHRNVETFDIDVSNDITLRSQSVSTNIRVVRESLLTTTRGLLLGPDGRDRVAHDKPMVAVDTGDYTMSFVAVLNIGMNGVHVRTSVSSSDVIEGMVIGQAFDESMQISTRKNGVTYNERFTIPGISTLLGTVVWVHGIRKDGELSVYLNGVRLPRFSSGVPLAESASSLDTKHFMVNIKSNVYEAAFWKRAVTAEETLLHFQNGIVPNNPEVLFTFNEQSGTRIADKSGNGYDGKIGVATNFWSTFTWLNPKRSSAGTFFNASNQIMPINTRLVSSSSSLCVGILPANPLLGDVISVTGQNTGGWRITQPDGHQIVEGAGATVGTNATTAGTAGQLNSTARYDSVDLVCVLADSVTPSYIWAITKKNGTLAWV
jgi:hypothetical protein